MNIGGRNYTNFSNLRAKGTGGNPGVYRFVIGSGFEGTLSVDSTYVDADQAYTLPAKTGTMPIAGTFTVQLAAIGAGSLSETSVTVSGIRAEDGLTCTVQDTFNTVTSNRPQAFLAGAAPANGGIHMSFYNPTGTATIANTLICGYTAIR